MYDVIMNKVLKCRNDVECWDTEQHRVEGGEQRYGRRSRETLAPFRFCNATDRNYLPANFSPRGPRRIGNWIHHRHSSSACFYSLPEVRIVGKVLAQTARNVTPVFFSFSLFFCLFRVNNLWHCSAIVRLPWTPAFIYLQTRQFSSGHSFPLVKCLRIQNEGNMKLVWRD